MVFMNENTFPSNDIRVTSMTTIERLLGLMVKDIMWYLFSTMKGWSFKEKLQCHPCSAVGYFNEGSGTLLVRLYKDAGTPAMMYHAPIQHSASGIPHMLQMLSGYRHYAHRKCPTSFEYKEWLAGWIPETSVHEKINIPHHSDSHGRYLCSRIIYTSVVEGWKLDLWFQNMTWWHPLSNDQLFSINYYQAGNESFHLL